jgi:hypothetical protein
MADPARVRAARRSIPLRGAPRSTFVRIVHRWFILAGVRREIARVQADIFGFEPASLRAPCLAACQGSA